MTALIQVLPGRTAKPLIDEAVARRGLALAALLAAALVIPGLGPGTPAVVVDATLEIAVFVAATLALVYGAEALFKTNLVALMERHRGWQVPAGAALGAFPGCGGAIVAVTQFTRGHMSFGGLVATLIATAGDAMFLLIAAEPATAGLVIGLSLAVGIAFGYGLDALHGPDFLRPARRIATDQAAVPLAWGPGRPIDRLWLTLMVPAAVLGIPATMADVDLVATLGAPLVMLALGAAVLGLVMWVLDDEPGECDGACAPRGIATQVAAGTNFVLAWVIFAMVGYEAVVLALGLNLESMLAQAAVVVPLAAVLIGFVPGCGPQVVVASLYISGALPLSAQLGNAIANDGDALFPAIAVAPKAAVVATLYSGIPAVLLAYGTYLLLE